MRLSESGVLRAGRVVYIKQSGLRKSVYGIPILLILLITFLTGLIPPFSFATSDSQPDSPAIPTESFPPAIPPEYPETAVSNLEFPEQIPPYFPEDNKFQPPVTPTFSPKPQTSNFQATYPQSIPSQPQSNETGLQADYLFELVNQYRNSIGKPSFEKEAGLCEVAASRAPEISGELAAGTLHSGILNRNLPYRVLENAISINSEQSAFNWWMNSSIHRASIESNRKYSCTKCYRNNCVQLFTNFEKR